MQGFNQIPDEYIKGKKLTRQVNLINELDDDIIGIDFMPIHKLHYVQSQVNLAGMDSHNIVAIMVFILQHQIQRKPFWDANYIANMDAPKTSALS